MVAVELLRTVFRGVALFLFFGAGSGIVAAILYLKFVSRLPDDKDRRLRTMSSQPGIDPITGQAADAPPRPRRSTTAVPVRLR